jgi:hypothetical protein
MKMVIHNFQLGQLVVSWNNPRFLVGRLFLPLITKGKIGGARCVGLRWTLRL